MRPGSLAIAIVSAAIVVAGCGAGRVASTASSAPSDLASVTNSPAATLQPRPSPTPLAILGEYPSAALPADVVAKLQAVLDGRIAQGAPDIIAAVVTADGSWTGAAGVDGPDGRLAQPGDAFGIASVSKTILAALVMRLVEEGRIDLDAPVATYAPDLAALANGSTVRQALAMRSGIGASPTAAFAGLGAHCDRVWTREELLATIPSPFASPGTQESYSNPTYRLLGWAAEAAAGIPLGEALTTKVLAPVGASGVLLQGPGVGPAKPWALPISGHEGEIPLAAYGTGGTLPCVGFSSEQLGVAGMAADAASLARWGWSLFAGKVVTSDHLREMLPIGNAIQGLGIERLSDFAPTMAYGHTGSQPGYAALLAVLPAQGIVIVCFGNDENADVSGAARELVKALAP